IDPDTCLLGLASNLPHTGFYHDRKIGSFEPCLFRSGESQKLRHRAVDSSYFILQDIFEYVQTGFEHGRVIGELGSTGLRPLFSEKFAAHNIELPDGTFAKPS
ncbi:hypothetical protein IH970_14270, partial [candidate division KSB1 bacterium]|nr:hypothetical protein [candidate division KSB1 bacterium]